MKTINLVPTPRREAKRRRRHRNVCAAACGIYGLLLACAVGAAHLLWSGAGAVVDEQLASTNSEIARFERQSAELRTELATARATIEANRTVAEQPDWSVLLALLGTTTSEEVVLRSISIIPTIAETRSTPAAKKPAAPAAPEVVLELIGVGRSQLAVSQHVLRLEQTGLFAKVALLDTAREAYLNGSAIAFRLQCTFGDAGQHRSALRAHNTSVSAVETGGSR